VSPVSIRGGLKPEKSGANLMIFPEKEENYQH